VRIKGGRQAIAGTCVLKVHAAAAEVSFDKDRVAAHVEEQKT
jgi:hypothetical protein